MNLPETNDENLKIALNVLISSKGKRANTSKSYSCVLNKNTWEDDEFSLYQGAGTALLILYHRKSHLTLYPTPDKESPHFAPLTLLLKVIAPYFYEDWIQYAKLTRLAPLLARKWSKTE